MTAKAIRELVPAEEWKARRKNATQPRTARGSISWKEWSGGARSRTFTEHTYSGDYEVKGDWLTFTYQGKQIRKKASENSITVIEDNA